MRKNPINLFSDIGSSKRIQKRVAEVLGESPSLYDLLKKGMDKTGILVLSILFIWSTYKLYIRSGQLPSNRDILQPYWIYLLPLTGMLYADDFDQPRICNYLRSSTDKEDNGIGLDSQDRILASVPDRIGGKIVATIRNIESASTMDRESIKNIINKAENGGFDILAMTDVDRLTRASLFETMRFFEKLKEEDITVYIDSIGLIDWDNPSDMRMLTNEAIFARQWYERIHDGAEAGYNEYLRKGKWPFAKTPFGYTKKEDKTLEVEKENREIIYRVFNIYVSTENRAETCRQINEKLQKSGSESELTDSQLKTILTSRLCIGQLAYKRTPVTTRPELRVVDTETFQQAQNILQERRYSDTEPDFPKFVSRAINRYSLDCVQSLIESLPRRCRKCGSRLEPWGSDSIWGIELRSYKCKNEDCEHQGPLLTEEEINELHQNLPLRCPYCPEAEAFSVDQVSHEKYRYECEICHSDFESTASPNKLKRGIENTEIAFNINQPTIIEQSTESEEPTQVSTGSDESQTDLWAFSS